MFLTLPAVILLSLTAKYSLAAVPPRPELNCTRIIGVEGSKCLTQLAVRTKEIVCYKVKSGRVELWYGIRNDKFMCSLRTSHSNCLKVVLNEERSIFVLCAAKYKDCKDCFWKCQHRRPFPKRPCPELEGQVTTATKPPEKTSSNTRANTEGQTKKHLPTPPAIKKKINGQHGFLTSPNYPKNYGTNQHYVYNIKFPENKRILLVFSNVDLAKPDGRGECTDYIGIYDGTAAWSTELYKFCGDGREFVNKPIVSKNNELKIKFLSDRVDAKNKGFNASYDVYQAPIAMRKIKKKMTGVIIGMACGLFFFALTLLAICQSRRATELYVQTDEQSLSDDPDAVHEKSPPSYDDVMASPEKYPVSVGPLKSKEDHWIEIPEKEELPAYPGLPIHAEPRDEIEEPNSEREMSADFDDVKLSQDIEADEALDSRDSITCSVMREVGIGGVGIREESKIRIDARNESFARDESDEEESDVRDVDVGESDVEECQVRESDVGEGEVGESDVGEDDVRKSNVGESVIKESDVGQSDVGGSDVRGKNDAERRGLSVVGACGFRKESDLQKGSNIKRAFDTEIDVLQDEVSTTNNGDVEAGVEPKMKTNHNRSDMRLTTHM